MHSLNPLARLADMRSLLGKLLSVLAFIGALTSPSFGAADATDISALEQGSPAPFALHSQNISEETRIDVAQSQVAQAIQAVVTIQNTTSLPVDVLYLNQTNNYERYQQVAPGTSIEAQATAGLVLYFGVNSSSIVGQYQITQQPRQTITITPDLLANAGIAAGANQNQQQGQMQGQQQQQTQTQQQAQNQQQQQQTQQQQQNPPVVSLDNQTGVQVDLLYVDQNRAYQVYRQIAPGERADVPSNVGLIWYFGANGQIVGQYQVNDAPSQPLVLNPELVGINNQQAQPGSQEQAPPADGVPANTVAPEDTPPPAAAPPVDTSDADDLTAAPTNDGLAVELASVTQSKVPARASWNAPTWALGSKNMWAMTNQGGDGFLTVNPHGEVVIESTRTATSMANWYLEPVAGTDDVFYMRNASQIDSYIYLDPNNPTSSEVLYGPQGVDLPTGQWRQVPHPAFDSLYLWMNVGAEGMALVAEGSPYVKAEFIPDLESVMFTKTWLVDTVPNFKEFFDTMLELVPAFQEMSDNFAELEADLARREEEARLEAARAEQLRKEAILRRVSWGTVMSYDNSSYPFVVTGQKPAFRNNDGVVGVEFIFDSDNTPKFENKLPQFQGEPEQSVELVLRPKLYAFVVDDVMYVRVRTEQPSGLNFKSGGSPSSNRPTEKTFYLESARLSVWNDNGTVQSYSPLNINSMSDLGRNSERNSGVNVSLQDIGGNFGASSGVNSNRSVLDYTVSGNMISEQNSNENRAASYAWTACGIAAVVATLDDCLYRTAADLFDEYSLSFKPLRPVATTMPLMETDTIFRIGNVNSININQVNLLVDVSLNTVAAYRARKDTTDVEEFGIGFKSFFKTIFTSEGHDHIADGTAFTNERLLQEVKSHHTGSRFKIGIGLDIRPLMTALREL